MSDDKPIQWEPTQVHLQVGDVITSKKGILVKGISGHWNVFRLKYRGNGNWEQLGDKREFVPDAKEVGEQK